MPFELREHTADIGVWAGGEDIAEVFEQLGEGLAAAMLDEVPSTGDRYPIDVRAADREALLFDYLDELIYQRDVHDVLPVDHSVSITADGDEWTLDGSFRGVPSRGLGGREIKAVTYSQMRLEHVGDRWEGYVVFDV